MHVFFSRTIFVHVSLEWFWFCTSHLCITPSVIHSFPLSVMFSFSWIACPLMLCLSSVPVEPCGFTLGFVLPALCLYLSRLCCPVCVIWLDLVRQDIIPTRTPLHRCSKTAPASYAPSCCYTYWESYIAKCCCMVYGLKLELFGCQFGHSTSGQIYCA